MGIGPGAGTARIGVRERKRVRRLVVGMCIFVCCCACCCIVVGVVCGGWRGGNDVSMYRDGKDMVCIEVV